MFYFIISLYGEAIKALSYLILNKDQLQLPWAARSPPINMQNQLHSGTLAAAFTGGGNVGTPAGVSQGQTGRPGTLPDVPMSSQPMVPPGQTPTLFPNPLPLTLTLAP